MYGLHQSPDRKIEFTDAYSLNAAFRELKEKTELKIHLSKTKWLGHDEKYGCDIYAIELNLKEKSQQIEQNKMNPQGIIP